MKFKAAILRKTGQPLEIERVEVPPLREGQVLVRVLFSGVCRAQLNEITALKGPDKYLPHMLGHEGVGVVIEAGPGVSKVKNGQTVVCTWIKGKGLDSHGMKIGDINAGPITTLTEYSVISENRLVPVDDSLRKNTTALLGCAVPTGAGMVKNQIGNGTGKSLAIFGVGGVGCCALLYAAHTGFARIIACDPNPDKQAFALAHGAHFASNGWVGDEKVDFAIEASGTKAGMETAFASVKDDGMAILAGNIRQGERIEINPFDFIKGKRLIGSWGGGTNPDADIPYYARIKLPLDDLVKEYSLDDVNQAFEDLASGKVMRPIVRM